MGTEFNPDTIAAEERLTLEEAFALSDPLPNWVHTHSLYDKWIEPGRTPTPQCSWCDRMDHTLPVFYALYEAHHVLTAGYNNTMPAKHKAYLARDSWLHDNGRIIVSDEWLLQPTYFYGPFRTSEGYVGLYDAANQLLGTASLTNVFQDYYAIPHYLYRFTSIPED
jgi:hypothetical protein